MLSISKIAYDLNSYKQLFFYNFYLIFVDELIISMIKYKIAFGLKIVIIIY